MVSGNGGYECKISGQDSVDDSESKYMHDSLQLSVPSMEGIARLRRSMETKDVPPPRHTHLQPSARSAMSDKAEVPTFIDIRVQKVCCVSCLYHHVKLREDGT